MAYNREWDKGKDTWNDAAAWATTNPRANVRTREEDYYSDGKRRKFNNGGFQGYDGTQPYDETAYAGASQYNRQIDHTHDNGQEDRRGGGGAGFAKKRLAPSEPSPHVIFLGLDPDFTEADLQAYLSSNGCSIETVTIIRERSSGSSKGFGFAQFTSTEHARAFVDPLFPFIQVPPPASHGASATAAFYKALETGVPHNGRRVKIDYSQSAAPHDKGRLNRGNVNDGTRDIGNTQAPVLLFRGLDPLSGPQAIYQAMLNSSGPGQQGAKGMKRIILIKDKVTMASFGFAFVEFVDVQSASTVLAATMSPQLHPAGFRISDRPVAASFAHPYSFQPVTDFLMRDDACLQSSMSLGGVEGSWVRYWDEGSTVAVLEFKVEETAQPVTVKAKEKKRVKVEADPSKAGPAAPSVLPVSDKPVTLSFNKGPVKATIGPSKPSVPTFSLDDANPAQDEPNEEHGSEPNKPLVVKKVAPLIASKKIASNINKWNQVQEELTQDTSAPVAAAPVAPSTKIATKFVPEPLARSTVEASLPAEEEFQFSDVNTLTCLLCARQFKSLDQLKRHNKESDLHKKNYKDANLRDVAHQKMLARKTTNSDQPKYRDRASERRILFNQPDTPLPEKDISKPVKKKPFEAQVQPPSPPPASINPGQDEGNVGNKLLKMMGWKEGTGLGTDGDGRVEPIQTAIYAQGVGLGASKGKEVGKYAEGYSGYVHMAQDAARERYGS
ncbi:hypothetical protein BDQ12DRAFT_732461 [Crucibulum laeve]|uniref:G-patch domain-containing protein n=1 Tax=Crucibulum laeve TaxID=68775 RepID=A0A5C3MBP6_9AGAR|nr:hypothetical protein BDQ12DRAFT_732461 [Crucibulum laeve]